MSTLDEESSSRYSIKMDSDHTQYSDHISDSDRSLSPNETMSAAAVAAASRNSSFCIDALLARDNQCNSPSAGGSSDTNTPKSSRSASISPGSEIQELRSTSSYDDMQQQSSFQQLPNSMADCSNMLTMSSAAAILPNHGSESNQSNRNFYGLYPVGSSAFQPLPRLDVNSRAISIPGAVSKMLGPVGHSTMTAGHLQQMQLEWFARAGMFYASPRLQESPGEFLLITCL